MVERSTQTTSANPIDAADYTPAKCWRCRYDLRGLTRPEVCPECGRPFRLTLEQRLLNLAPEEYVHRLRVGIDVALAGMAMATLGVPWYAFSDTWRGWASACCGVGVLVTSAGWFLMTVPDPSLRDIWREHRARRLSRLAAAIGLLVGPAIAALGSAILPGSLLAVPGPVWVLVVSAVAGLMIWQFGSAMVFLGFIAARLPNPKVADFGTTNGWSLQLTGSAILVLAIIMVIAKIIKGVPAFQVPVVAAMGLALVIFLPYSAAVALSALPRYPIAIWQVRAGLHQIERKS